MNTTEPRLAPGECILAEDATQLLIGPCPTNDAAVGAGFVTFLIGVAVVVGIWLVPEIDRRRQQYEALIQQGRNAL
jgi:hypothetical protein